MPATLTRMSREGLSLHSLVDQVSAMSFDGDVEVFDDTGSAEVLAPNPGFRRRRQRRRRRWPRAPPPAARATATARPSPLAAPVTSAAPAGNGHTTHVVLPSDPSRVDRCLTCRGGGDRTTAPRALARSLAFGAGSGSRPPSGRRRAAAISSSCRKECQGHLIRRPSAFRSPPDHRAEPKPAVPCRLAGVARARSGRISSGPLTRWSVIGGGTQVFIS